MAGQAALAQNGNQLTITQGSDKAILNWQRFDIGSQAAVRFIQPSTSSVALNRVLSGEASQIQGQLSANGQVYLVNPNGVIFGAGAKVDVGGLVASTLDITNEDFLAGKLRFNRNGATGAILNQGEISAREGGLPLRNSPAVATTGNTLPGSGQLRRVTEDQERVFSTPQQPMAPNIPLIAMAPMSFIPYLAVGRDFIALPR